MRIIGIWHRQASLADKPGNDFLAPQGVASRITIRFFWWRANAFPFFPEYGQLWIDNVHSFDWNSGCSGQRGDWDAGVAPGHAPSESELITFHGCSGLGRAYSRDLDKDAACAGQRGGWATLVVPGHVPSESVHFNSSLGQRGG